MINERGYCIEFFPGEGEGQEKERKERQEFYFEVGGLIDEDILSSSFTVAVFLERRIRVIVLPPLSVVVKLQVHSLLNEEKPPLLLCIKNLFGNSQQL